MAGTIKGVGFDIDFGSLGKLQDLCLPDKVLGYPIELEEPLEMTCKVEFGSLHDLIPQRQGIFTVFWSKRQHKRNRRRLMRNNKRANGTRRKIKFRKNCHVLKDFDCVMENHSINGNDMNIYMRKV